MGILHVRYELYNSHGEHVMTMLTPQMLYRRNSGAPS
jgi:acyl dehydratase